MWKSRFLSNSWILSSSMVQIYVPLSVPLFSFCLTTVEQCNYQKGGMNKSTPAV